MMILAQAHPHESEDAIAERLMEIRPQVWPNSRMIAFADELLDRGGRLVAATGAIYARQLAKRPELGEIMRQGNRGREVEFGLGRPQASLFQQAKRAMARFAANEDRTAADFGAVRTRSTLLDRAGAPTRRV